MRVIIQRVQKASVTVDKEIISSIHHGFLLLVGITHDDDDKIIKKVADKVANLRVFTDSEDKMNLALKDVEGDILSVSQFTLYADVKKGRRPSFTAAAKPEFANECYMKFNDELRSMGLKVETGKFQADMKVELINDGPITIIVDSKDL